MSTDLNRDSDRTGNRAAARIVAGMPTSDGAGVRLTRIIGAPGLPDLDPFLLFDIFESDNPDDYIAGFPPHPHRGFETVTYMIEGRMRHKDSTGREGVIEAGDVQWMKAARGIIHSEMPEQKAGLLKGTQLWINLPAAEKMSDPAYQEYPAADIPEETREAARVKLVAGRSGHGLDGAVTGKSTAPYYADVRLEAGAAFIEDIPASHAGFVYVIEGEIRILGDLDTEDQTVSARSAALLGAGDRLQILGATEARFLVIAARRLDEPVARRGPFVMNTEAELYQAVQDYQAGRF